MKALNKASKTREEWIQQAIKTNVHPTHVAKDPQRWVDHFARRYARLQVLHAVKSGELVKPSHCSSCGQGPLPKIKVQGHHPNYNEPLNVEWLCSKCHYDRHRGRFFTR